MIWEEITSVKGERGRVAIYLLVSKRVRSLTLSRAVLDFKKYHFERRF